MKLPIWQTITTSLSLAFCNIFNIQILKYLTYFIIVQLLLQSYFPTNICDNLIQFFFGISNYNTSKSIVTILMNVLLNAIVYICYYSILRRFINNESQSNLFKILPLPDKRDIKALWHGAYIIIRAAIFPVITVLLIIYGASYMNLSATLLIKIIFIITIIAFIFIGATLTEWQLAPVYSALYKHKLSASELIKHSYKVIKGNIWIFILIAIILFIIFFIIGFIYGFIMAILSRILPLNLEANFIIKVIYNAFINYITMVWYASFTSAVYSYFKPQFEAKVAQDPVLIKEQLI